jgi:hypothetical protein
MNNVHVSCSYNRYGYGTGIARMVIRENITKHAFADNQRPRNADSGQ